MARELHVFEGLRAALESGSLKVPALLTGLSARHSAESVG